MASVPLWEESEPGFELTLSGSIRLFLVLLVLLILPWYDVTKLLWCIGRSMRLSLLLELASSM